MLKLIVTDIFGKTPQLELLCQQLASEVEVVDPYQGQQLTFKDEADAYQYFTESIGLTNYINHLEQKINNTEGELSLLGFSVGAAAIWALSEKFNSNKISSGLCFYGNQIRHFLDKVPKFPIKVIFPRYEEHFSVAQLSEILECKDNVVIEHTKYLHGFFNESSTNYNADGHQEYHSQLMTLSAEQGFS